MRPNIIKNIKILDLNDDFLGNCYNFDDLMYTKEGQSILKTAHKFKQKLFCICNGENNPIPMTNCIMPSRKGYYLRRNKNTKHLHNINCPLYNIQKNDILQNITKKSPSTNANIIYNEKGLLNIIIKNNSVLDNIPKKIYKNQKSHKIISKIKNPYKANTHSSIFGIGDILLSYAWSDYVTNKKNNNIPRSGNLFYIIYNKDINILIDTFVGKIKIQNIMPNLILKEKNTDITKYTYNKILNIYKSINDTKSFKGYNAYILGSIGEDLYNIKTTNEYVKLKVNDSFLNNYYYIYTTLNYYLSIRNKTKKVKDSEYYISAFVRPENNKIFVSEMAFIPVCPKYGFSVDSSKEIEFAKERLFPTRYYKDILFVKPSKYAIIYDLFEGRNYIPDFLLLDRETRKITTIVEVFGYYTDEYLKEQNEKIKYYNSLPYYHFIAWEANKNKKMPFVPRIQKLKQINISKGVQDTNV